MRTLRLFSAFCISFSLSGYAIAQEKESEFWKGFKNELGKAAAQVLIEVVKEAVNTPASSSIAIKTPATYSFKPNSEQIEIKIDRINNVGRVPSNKMQVRLYATETKYVQGQPGGITGYVMAEKYLDPLQPGYGYGDISWVLRRTDPPAGRRYFVTLVVSEQGSDGKFYIESTANFRDQLER